MKTKTTLIAVLAMGASIIGASAANIIISGSVSITGTLNQNGTSFTENTGNTINEGTMASSVLTAYNNNTGGVWTFDGSMGSANNNDTFSLSYGVSQTNTLVLTFTEGAGGGGINQGSNGGTTASGANNLAFGGSAVFKTFTPDQPLQSVGIFELNRFDSSRLFTFSATLMDNSVVTTGTGNGGTTYWNGFTATGSNYIKSFTINQTALTRYDDLAFVVAPAVPEPTTIVSLLGGVGMLALLRRRA